MKRTQPMAFLALWNSVAPQRQPEYEIWHSFEHVPERCALPGFIEARRYRSRISPRHYFTCYQVASLEAFQTAEYQDVMAHPTPWSASMRPALHDFLRLPCALQGTRGPSSGAHVAVGVLDVAPGDLPRMRELMQGIEERQGVACVQWGKVADMGLYPVAQLGGQSSNASTALAQDRRHVVMLQGIEHEPLVRVADRIARELAEFCILVREPSVFELLSQTRQDDLPTPPGVRPAPRLDLFHAFHPGDNP